MNKLASLLSVFRLFILLLLRNVKQKHIIITITISYHQIIIGYHPILILIQGHCIQYSIQIAGRVYRLIIITIIIIIATESDYYQCFVL